MGYSLFISNQKKLKILTPYGWENFSGVLIDKQSKPGLYISTKNTQINVTVNHPIKTPTGFVKANVLKQCDIISTIFGDEPITKINHSTIHGTYEIIDTESHEVVVNDVYNHQCDEFAFVKGSIQDKFWTSISPTLSTGGGCMIASTPNGDSNKFAEIWFTATALQKENALTADDFVPMEIKWNDVPGRGEDFKNAIIKKEGMNHWLQEYDCKFISSDNLLIDTNKLDEMNKTVEAPFFTSKKHKIQFWEAFKPNKQYIVSVDPATGTSKDFSVISIFEFPSLNQIALYRTNCMSSPELYVILTDLLKAIEAVGGQSYVSVENNGVGEGMISLYLVDEYFPVTSKFVSESPKKMGFVTSNKSKWVSCLVLKDMLENDDMLIRSPTMLKELKTFVRKGPSFTAQVGGTDDCISAILIMIRVLEKMTTFDPQAYNKYYTERHVRASNTVSMTKSDIDKALPY